MLTRQSTHPPTHMLRYIVPLPFSTTSMAVRCEFGSRASCATMPGGRSKYPKNQVKSESPLASGSSSSSNSVKQRKRRRKSAQSPLASGSSVGSRSKKHRKKILRSRSAANRESAQPVKKQKWLTSLQLGIRGIVLLTLTQDGPVLFTRAARAVEDVDEEHSSFLPGVVMLFLLIIAFLIGMLCGCCCMHVLGSRSKKQIVQRNLVERVEVAPQSPCSPLQRATATT